MASTYSSLKIQLMATGENTTTWGTVTNVNLGTALEEAITGSADVAFSSANVTLTLTDTNATQTARNLRLNLTGTTGGARNLVVPAIEKIYLVNNGCADAVTIKNASGSGIAVAAGKTMWVFNDGTNIVEAVNYLSTLTLGTPLAATQGGTGITSFGAGVATWLGTPSSANLAAALTDETGSGAAVFANSPTLVAPALGTPASVNLTNATALPLDTGVANTLAPSHGGTGQASFTDGQLLIGNSSGGGLSKATLTQGANVTITNGNGTITIAASGGGGGGVTSVGGTGTVNGISLSGTVTSTGNLTLGGALSGVDLASQVTGTLPVGNVETGTSGTKIPLLSGANTWGAAQGIPTGSTYSSRRIASVASGTSTNTGKISWGTAAPGTLDEGEIYLRYS